MKRIVQLTTYPLKAPRHGGQLRCAAIRACWRDAGFEVATVAAIHGSDYRPADLERDDLVLPADHAAFDPRLARFIDLQSGELIARDDGAIWRAFSRTLDRLAPDAISLEQPWLYPAARRWIDARTAAGAPPPRLVYSSQNIEWKLKRDECAGGLRDAAQADAVARVERLEREAVRHADLVVACTDEELAELRAMDDTPRSRGWVVARNAISPFEADPQRVADVRRRLGLDRYAVFVGSAHPPNADGFWRMLAPSLAFLRPDERIVVVGGVVNFLRAHPVYRAWPAIDEPRLVTPGEIERDDLVALLGGAHVVLLPITTGGGSNLKTAEAIYSGRPVLATPHALRGYGDALRWPTVTVAEDADAFRRALRALLDRPVSPPPADHAARRPEVTWAHALAPLARAVRELDSAAPAAPDAGVRERLQRIRSAIERRGGVDYESLLERQYTRLLRKGDTVVDVGAHAGRHLARFVDCVGRDGRVVGFEPLPGMHARLLRSFGATANVTLHNVALSDDDGRVEFVHAVGAPEESGLRERTYNNPTAVTPTRIEVEARRLDAYVDALAGLRFIKIDVEGAEMNVLRGAVDVLARYRPVLSVEYGRPAYGAYGHDTWTLFDFAERHGYAMYDVFAHRLDRTDWGIACDSVYWDYFMVPLEREGEFAHAVPPLAPDCLG
ncbi:FkbM family methyltransferase [Dokdonella sp.]|uniref:FkbM family methyltransferase n=1 Tax=Dokdonella sp. TaxID=2291710 RepID=UPI002F42FBC1